MTTRKDDQPDFITEAARHRLQAQMDLDSYEELVDQWAAHLDQPHVVECNRSYLETIWVLEQPPAPAPEHSLLHIIKAFLAWLNS